MLFIKDERKNVERILNDSDYTLGEKINYLTNKRLELSDEIEEIETTISNLPFFDPLDLITTYEYNLDQLEEFDNELYELIEELEVTN